MGERLGGRQKGTKNKRTIERESLIARAIGELDRPLGKDVLAEAMIEVRRMAKELSPKVADDEDSRARARARIRWGSQALRGRRPALRSPRRILAEDLPRRPLAAPPPADRPRDRAGGDSGRSRQRQAGGAAGPCGDRRFIVPAVIYDRMT
jgi:hypothetical protein